MRAILDISLRDAMCVHHQNHRGRPRLEWQARAALTKAARAQEALEWIFDDNADGVFSFASVCETLGIDGGKLRGRVRRQSADKRAAGAFRKDLAEFEVQCHTAAKSWKPTDRWKPG